MVAQFIHQNCARKMRSIKFKSHQVMPSVVTVEDRGRTCYRNVSRGNTDTANYKATYSYVKSIYF